MEFRPQLQTRWQAEVLLRLEHGRSTRQIADELHLSTETELWNHVRRLRQALGVHSRLEVWRSPGATTLVAS